jgi:hypothetical protein
MVGFLVALSLTLSSATAPQTPEQESPPQLAQATLGLNCTTPAGICPIPPQPIGSVCYCGQTPGFVTP